MLAISQIEISVKRFWSNLYNQFPKPEFDALGVSFGESEIRHSRAYANVLELLGLKNKRGETFGYCLSLYSSYGLKQCLNFLK
jgi:hypothetical protein